MIQILIGLLQIAFIGGAIYLWCTYEGVMVAVCLAGILFVAYWLGEIILCIIKTQFFRLGGRGF